MWIYSHTTYTLKGYTRLTHEPVQFLEDEIQEVTEEVGAHLLGTYPLQFCRVEAKSQTEAHRRLCPLYYKSAEGNLPVVEEPSYRNRRLGRPPKNRMMRTS